MVTNSVGKDKSNFQIKTQSLPAQTKSNLSPGGILFLWDMIPMVLAFLQNKQVSYDNFSKAQVKS